MTPRRRSAAKPADPVDTGMTVAAGDTAVDEADEDVAVRLADGSYVVAPGMRVQHGVGFEHQVYAEGDRIDLSDETAEQIGDLLRAGVIVRE